MALGRRRDGQQEMRVATTQLSKSPGRVFYRKLNKLLSKVEIDRENEELCRPYYAERRGRPSIPPGVYVRMSLVGFFGGVGSHAESSGGAATTFRCVNISGSRQRLAFRITSA